MFAVLATAALALSGPLVGRSPHLRAPRPILEPPAVVDPPLVVSRDDDLEARLASAIDFSPLRRVPLLLRRWRG